MSLKSMQSNIRHVVHLMMENRSFDHFLGWLRWDGRPFPKKHVPPLRLNEQQFYGLDGTQWVPSNRSFYFPEGPFLFTKEFIFAIQPNGPDDFCEMPPADPGEAFEDVQEQIYGTTNPGLRPTTPVERTMKGFYINYRTARLPNIGEDRFILAAFTPTTLPTINKLAESFAVSDMWFSSVPTQTNPNRAFSLCGTSLGRINNSNDLETFRFCGEPYKGAQTIFSVFNSFSQKNPDKAVRWKIYAQNNWHDVSPELLGGWKFWERVGEAGKCCEEATRDLLFTQYEFPEGTRDTQFGGTGTIDDFKRDVAQGTLPDFSYLEPSFIPQETVEASKLNSYHPPESVFSGEALLQEIFETLTGNPEVWKQTLFIVTFDEHGGTYDHILPPTNAPQPDANRHTNPDFDFTRYGVRVPTLLISPWVTPGTVFRAGYFPETTDPRALPFDHTSVLATLCQWKGIDYQDPSGKPELYLGKRTAVAPTFFDVITDTENDILPSLELPGCRTFIPGADARREEVVKGLARRVAELTGFAANDDATFAIVDDLLARSRNDEELKENLESLESKPPAFP